MCRNRSPTRTGRVLPMAVLWLSGCAGLPGGGEPSMPEPAPLEQSTLVAEYRELLSLAPARAQERLQQLEPGAGNCDRDRLHQAMLRTHPAVEPPEPATASADFEPCRAAPPPGASDLVAVIDTQLRRASRDAAEIRLLESEL